MKKILIYFFAICFVVNLAFAQSGGLHNPNSKTSDKNNYDLIDKEILKKLDKFFQKVVANQIDDGYDELLKNSPILLKKDDISIIKKQTIRSIEVYGKIQGFEFVNEDVVTESFIRLRYLGLHTNYPMRWVFTFYRSPEKGWIVSNIKLDDQSEFFFSD